MFLDPYASEDNGVKLPNWFARLLYGITFPCLTSSFCLIHLAFREVVKIQVGPKKIRSVQFVVSVIITHFALEITVAIAIAMSTACAINDRMPVIFHSLGISSDCRLYLQWFESHSSR